MCDFLQIFMKEDSEYDVPFPPRLHLTKTMRFIKIKYFDIIRRNYKLKSLILCSECVTSYDFLRQGFAEEKREIKQVITAVRNTHFIVYWYTEGNTDLHKGDVIVHGVAIVIFMTDYFCSSMNSSTRIWVSGAKPYREKADSTPVDRKVRVLILNMQLIERYNMNYIRSLTVNILCVYI